jgi:molecular chaperone DnaK (HSP70)
VGQPLIPSFFLISAAVGVDLGTTFSVVGVNKNGKVVIIEDKAGHKIFPSIVSYMDNGGALFDLAFLLWQTTTNHHNLQMR